MKKFLITGGNFMNTGAAAMSYVTISELRKRYPDCNITMAIDYGDGSAFDNLKCNIIYLNNDCMKLLSGTLPTVRRIKAIIKKYLGKEDAFRQANEFRKVLKECDAAFDISGYILSSQWDLNGNIEKLGQMGIILKNEIPYYIMPQSFGPFEYGNNNEWMIPQIKDILSCCKVVYAREKEGYLLLKDKMGLDNVLYSPDIVLQSKRIYWDTIFKSEPITNYDISIPENSVAVIPNMRILEQNNDDLVMKIYSTAISELLLLRKTVYLISHSAEDKTLCKRLKALFLEDEVYYLDEKMDSKTFEYVIQKMDFAIASRFHSIVHAYKNDIPCIILGWAIKYKELASLFEQEQYVFDIKETDDAKTLANAEKKLNERYKIEKEIIEKKLSMIQQSNCFDSLNF